MQWEFPDEFNDTVLEFLGEHKSSKKWDCGLQDKDCKHHLFLVNSRKKDTLKIKPSKPVQPSCGHDPSQCGLAVHLLLNYHSSMLLLVCFRQRPWHCIIKFHSVRLYIPAHSFVIKYHCEKSTQAPSTCVGKVYGILSPSGHHRAVVRTSPEQVQISCSQRSTVQPTPPRLENHNPSSWVCLDDPAVHLTHLVKEVAYQQNLTWHWCFTSHGRQSGLVTDSVVKLRAQGGDCNLAYSWSCLDPCLVVFWHEFVAGFQCVISLHMAGLAPLRLQSTTADVPLSYGV